MSLDTSLANAKLAPLPDELLNALPRPPTIYCRRLAQLAFTHKGYNNAPRRGITLSFTEEDEGQQDNEKLEHVGDALIGNVVTVLLDEMWPKMRDGPATSQDDGQPVESYTAALFQSYLFGYGSDDATSVPLPPSPDTSAVYGYEYGSPSNQIRKRTNGQALDMVEAWLKPVFTPLAQHVLGEMKRAQASWSSAVAYGDDDDEDRMAQGAAAVLNEHFIGKLHSIKPTFEEVPNKDPTLKAWRMRCIATDREGVQYIGEASRSTKQAAKTVSAWKVCRQLNLM